MLVWMMYKIRYIHEIYLEETDIGMSLIVIGVDTVKFHKASNCVIPTAQVQKNLCELVKSVGEQKEENRNFMNFPVIPSKHGE